MAKAIVAFIRAVLIPAILLGFAAPVVAGTFTVFQKTYVRDTGAPVTVTDTFSVLNPNTSYTLKAFNGGLQDASAELVSSSVVVLNGSEVLGPSNLNQQVTEVDVPVTLQIANTISVQLRGQPGGTLTIVIVGVDNDPPVIKAVASLPPNAAGWNNSPVTVTFTCSDAISGVATCPPPQTVSSDGANQLITGKATDNAGNTATASLTVNLDQTPPTIGAAPSPAANAAGWNNTDVRVSFTCADAVSGIAACTPATTITTEGTKQVVTGTATDLAGNTASTSLTLNIDKTPPAIHPAATPLPNGAGWNNSDVTVTFTCSDAISGIANCPPGQSVTTEGANQAISATATDLAGNSATASVTLNIDKTPPAIHTTSSPLPNAAGWNNSDVSVAFVCADSLSGIAACPQPQSVTTEGVNQAISATATDIAGNTATASASVNLDKTPPEITSSVSPAANAAGWNNSDTTVSFTCSDSLSGVDSCSAPVTVTTEGAHQSQTGIVVDKAGNTAQATASVSLDKTPPAVSISAPADGATVRTTSTDVSGSGSDSLSGIASITCNGIPGTLSGGNFDCTVPLSAGSNSIAVQALDLAGNAATAPLAVTFQAVPPSITLTPGLGTAGTTVTVAITAMNNSGFIAGTTTASFGPGTSVGGGPIGGPGPLTVLTATTATAQVTIAPNAVFGNQAVVVQTGGEQIQGTFTVNSPAVAAACVPSGSQSLLVQGSNVTAYVPNGTWGGGGKNVQVVPIEGSGSPATVVTPNVVNSCASNWVTGQTVCTANTNDVYLLHDTTLTNTLTSGSSGLAGGISGGTCKNCGVAINAAANQAVISMGLASGDGVQVLDLNTNTFSPPISGGISENIVVDPLRNLVLSPTESKVYNVFDLGGRKAYHYNISGIVQSGSSPDSAGEDCTTGIALSTEEDGYQLFLTDLTQATFDAGTSTWTAPAQSQPIPEFAGISIEGIAVASTAHLGIVWDEFGYRSFAVIQLPATSGSGTPALQDYAVATIPVDPSGSAQFEATDPHTLTAYVSPNDGKAYGVLASFLGDRYLMIADLQGILNAQRSAAHTVSSSVDLVAAGLVRFVAIDKAPSQLAFSPQPAGSVAGQLLSIHVAVEDAQGNVDTNSRNTVSLTVNGPLGSSAPITAAATNGIANFTLDIQAAGTYTATASVAGVPPATSNPFMITPYAATTRLSFAAQPANIAAGSALPTIQVARKDEFGNLVPGGDPIILALAGNTNGATLSGTVSAVPVNGIASFPGLTVDTAGTYFLAATESALQAGSTTFAVTNGAATQLDFVLGPATVAAGSFLGTVKVAVEDQFGNTVSNATNTITVALGSNPTDATLSGTKTVVAGNGAAFFQSLSVNYAGVGYTLVASSPGLTSAVSAPFNITGGGPPITLTPAIIQQGATLSISITTQNTHFQQGVTTASFGPGLTVGSGMAGGYGLLNVTSATTATLQLSAAADATPGPRTVLVQTGSEQFTFFDAFAVVGTPYLLSASPGSGHPGDTLSVTITGQFTKFLPGTTQASFGAGISVGGGAAGGYGPVTVTAPGTAVAQINIAAGAAVGLRVITVQTGGEVASLANGGFLVLGSIVGPPPAFSFASLAEGMEITAPTAVTGTIASPNPGTWSLQYAPAGSSSFTSFASGTGLTVSGTLDPTLLINGITAVRLVATDQSGQTTATTVNVVVTRKLKVGNFSLAFTDLSIPVAGIPLQIVRSYDSRDKTVGDFGYGWTLAIKSVKVRTSDILGNNWVGTSTGGLLPTYCVQPGQNYVVSVRLQDDTVYQFQPVPTPGTQCALIVPPSSVDLMYVPIGATPPSAQLAQANATGLIVSGAFPGNIQLVDPSTVETYGNAGDTDQWTLTLPSGQKLQVSVTAGVQAITDTNNNTLTIGPNGITSSLGPAVVFTRDTQSRITSIKDPKGNLLHYAYNSNGDLATFTDQRNNASSFSYDAAHYLTAYTDPAGAQPIKNVYDDSGRLIEQIDALGRVQTFAHDLAASTESFTDFLGNTTTYLYDAHGNIVQETDALGNVTTKTFDARDNLLSVTNPLGKTTLYTYDANRNRLSVTDPLGNTTRFTYNGLNEVLTTTDPDGNRTVRTYDSVGNLLTHSDPLGNTTQRTYTGSGLPATLTDAMGNTTKYAYDSNGRLASVTNPLGSSVSYTYDGNGNRLSESVTRTTAGGQQVLTTQFQYDAQNQVVKTSYPDGAATQTVYDRLGQKSATTDELGRQTSYAYDADRRLVKTTYPDGTSEATGYDAVGNKVAFTDRSGATTTYAYDALHRLLSTSDALGGVISSAYDAAGQEISRTDARGNVTHYGYDDAGRQTSVTNTVGGVAQFTFDAASLPVTAKDPAGHSTAFHYDADSRLTQITHPDGTSDAVSYDGRGNIAARVDAAGGTTQYLRDGAGRLVSVTDALGHTTSYSYDEVGNRVSVTDANGHVTRMQYDARGRRTSRTLPGGHSESLAYDPAGELSSRTDFNGNTTTYAYDAAGRLLSKTPDPSFHAAAVTYSYTELGKRAAMTDATGTTSYAYDALGRLTLKQSPEGSIAYTYDANGNVVQLQAGTMAITYAYDAGNRLASVADPAAGTTSYSYDSSGNLQSVTYPNGLAHTYTRDTRNRLAGLNITANGVPVSSYAYTLDATGHRTSVSELGGRTVVYTYDALHRLTGEGVAGDGGGIDGTVAYAYDAVGNRVQTSSALAGIPSGSFSYDVDDRLSDDTYDLAGNTVNSGGVANAYDFENRMVQHGSVSIAYDGDGNRVSRTAGGITTTYLVDDHNPTGIAQVLVESSSDGTLRSYTYGLQRISQFSNSSPIRFYAYDGRHSVRALADAAGAITDAYEYDAFGNLLRATGNTANDFRFGGEQFDPALGIYFNRARYYDQRRGRFWSMDAVEGDAHDPQTLHRYLYVRADPVNRHDPSGNQDDLVEAAIDAAVEAELSEVAVADTVSAAAVADTAIADAAYAGTVSNFAAANTVLAGETVLTDSAAVDALEAVEAAESAAAESAVNAEEVALWNTELQAQIAATKEAWWAGLSELEKAEFISTELDMLFGDGAGASAGGGVLTNLFKVFGGL